MMNAKLSGPDNDDRNQNISNQNNDEKTDLAMLFDGFTLLRKHCQLTIPSEFGAIDNDDAVTIDYRTTTSMVVDLCRSLSFLVRWENENETQKASANRSHSVRRTGDTDEKGNNHSRVRMIVPLSKVVMEFLDTESASNLSAEEVDHMVLGCLLNTYRLPSVVNVFETETVQFYEWWRRRIKCWIGRPFCSNNRSASAYQQLGWRHLAVMIRETQDHLRPPPLSVMVIGARSKEVNGEYKLVGRSSSSTTNDGIQYQEKQTQIFYSQKVMYENTMADGRTFSLCLSRVDHSPTSISQDRSGYSLWFLTELDEEQPNTDCDIDYYCALPRNGKHTRPNPIPPLRGWKRCSHGLFPPPTLVPSGSVGLGPDTHWQRLARWILEEDLVATCAWWCTHQQRCETVDSGFSSVLEFMNNIYEEGGNINHGMAASSSLGTEFIVKFAASCLERRQERR